MAGYWEFQRAGVRAARVDAILAGTGVTKGAFYHHFPTKFALAAAVVDELVAGQISATWLDPVRDAGHPIDGLRTAIAGLEALSPEGLLAGCPLANLLQDVADGGAEAPLRDQLLALLAGWRREWTHQLARGQQAGHVRLDLHPGVTAGFLIATYHGLAATARAERSPSTARRLLRTYATLVDTLRAH